MFVMMAAVHSLTQVQDDALKGAPWWARVALVIGIPSAAAIAVTVFALNFLTGDQRADIKAILSLQQSHTAAMQLAADEQKTTAATLRLVMEYQQRLLERICMNTARTDVDRLGCLPLANR